ncbi:MAG TPA: hypothetical protein VNB23_07805 [Ramlibacter sp.]|nr:hypothetical protein [Ramlibacter sp.]
MYGINGQAIVDLDPYVDVAGFNALVEECTLGLARSQWDVGSFGPGVYDKDLTRDLYAIETGVYRPPRAGRRPHPDAEYLRGALRNMTINQRRMYLKLRYGLYNSGHSVYLRQPTDNNYMVLNQPELNRWTANAAQFPGLVAWIKQLPFAGLGRILFFINEHCCPVVEHSDLHSSDVARGYVADRPHTHEFLWIRPSVENAKGFYVLDERDGTKHHVKGNAAWFNSFDVHGADAGPTMTWSLRVDGQFTDAFRNTLLQQEDSAAVTA